jgi:hypothetical protein
MLLVIACRMTWVHCGLHRMLAHDMPYILWAAQSLFASKQMLKPDEAGKGQSCRRGLAALGWCHAAALISRQVRLHVIALR